MFHCLHHLFLYSSINFAEAIVLEYIEHNNDLSILLGHERMSYYSNVRSNIECSNGSLDIQIKNN